MSNFAASLIFVLALLALGIVIYIVRAKSAGKLKLEKDSSGLWRYHKDTLFELKQSYEKELDDKLPSKSILERLSGLKSLFQSSTPPEEKSVVVVLNFQGDLRAKEHDSFAALVDEVEVNKERVEEVVVVISSPGGMVAPYGHVYAQMERLRNLGTDLTVCIDTVAASGGYLMSLPATRIIAAPFAVVGSVGVVAFVPNIRGLLVNWSVDPRTFSAGKYKRTVSLTDRATREEVARFQSQLDTIHEYFIAAVKKFRPNINFDEIETGDHWTAQESIDKELGLVDEVGCSQEYLLRKNKEKDLLFLSQKTSMWNLGGLRLASAIAEQIEERLYARQNPLF